MFFEFLQEAFIDPVTKDMQELLGPDFDCSFTDKWIVFGDGPEISAEFSRFFIESGRLNFEILRHLLENIHLSHNQLNLQ